MKTLDRSVVHKIHKILTNQSSIILCQTPLCCYNNDNNNNNNNNNGKFISEKKIDLSIVTK